MSASLTANIINKYQGVAPNAVVQAVKTASARTGVDFSFLMEKARTESSFNPTAKAKTSSATGLYQFIENTWLTMIKNHGAKYGLGALADKITINDKGRACVDGNCADTRRAILGLRNDPKISALMAGEFTAENKAALEQATDGTVGKTELYLAHFLGAGSAAKFLNSRAANPDVPAASLFPAAAKANRSVFYDSNGRARSLDEIYQRFSRRFGDDTPPPSSHRVSPRMPEATASLPLTRPLTAADALQALPVFDDTNAADDIIWNDDPRFFGRREDHIALNKLAPQMMLTLLEMQHAPRMTAEDLTRQNARRG